MLDVNGTGWLQLVLVLVVGAFINTIMTTKFVYAASSKLSQMGRLHDKTTISWCWNYMGVVFRLPIASPGHRLMEIHYVH